MSSSNNTLIFIIADKSSIKKEKNIEMIQKFFLKFNKNLKLIDYDFNYERIKINLYNQPINENNEKFYKNEFLVD